MEEHVLELQASLEERCNGLEQRLRKEEEHRKVIPVPP